MNEMAYEKPKNYVEVKDRIIEFRSKHPNGYLQSDPVEWIRDEAGKIIGLTIQARAYREPGGVYGVGSAFEFYPGKTPYTKGSEVQNAETSAWGRALIALGAADAQHGIASADEVRRAQSSSDESPPWNTVDPIESKRAEVIAALKANQAPAEAVQAKVAELGFPALSKVNTVDGLNVVLAWAVQKGWES